MSEVNGKFVIKLCSLPKHSTDLCNWCNYKHTFSPNGKWKNAA